MVSLLVARKLHTLFDESGIYDPVLDPLCWVVPHRLLVILYHITLDVVGILTVKSDCEWTCLSQREDRVRFTSSIL